nr:MAG TPA: hypothetical protein [Caudoviricetes sp.]
MHPLVFQQINLYFYAHQTRFGGEKSYQWYVSF